MAISQIVTNSVASGQTLTSPTLVSAVFTTPASSVITSGTAVASTSGTSIDFTSIPSWVKRITVMFNGVSTNGTSTIQTQLGAGSVTTSGYVCAAGFYGPSQNAYTSTSGFAFSGWGAASIAMTGLLTFCLVGSNTWIGTGIYNADTQAYQSTLSGKITLGGTLDRVRITTVNGTDTFDAGSINILYE